MNLDELRELAIKARFRIDHGLIDIVKIYIYLIQHQRIRMRTH